MGRSEGTKCDVTDLVCHVGADVEDAFWVVGVDVEWDAVVG